jgi:short-subunit dehydrogenase
VVVGAGQGIGAEFCRQLAARGMNLMMVALEDEELRELASELEATRKVETKVLVGDITSSEVLASLDTAIKGLDAGLLIYNAALSSTEPWLDTSIEKHLSMVNVNVRGPLTLMDRFVPAMVQRGRGGVILLSSMSALQGSPLVATYAATKAFTLNLAESLWDEWRPHGVDVLAVIPGPTDTPGFRASAPRPTRGAPAPMSAEQVVREALAAIGSRPWVIPGRMNKILGFAFSRVLPRRRAIGFMGRTMRAMYGRRKA